MDVFVLETIHCPGSLGFFFREWGILYLGDTRITPALRRIIRSLNPHTILYDGTHEQVKHIQPSIDTSAILLHQVIQQQLQTSQDPIHLCLAHIGSLLLIQELDLKVRIHDSLKADVVTLLHHGGWVDPASRIVAVGMKASRRDIMPSSLFFVVNDLDPTKPVQDKETLRIFVSFHSSQAELELLNEFELAPLHYQPIIRIIDKVNQGGRVNQRHQGTKGEKSIKQESVQNTVAESKTQRNRTRKKDP
jgi:hypothetical protein